MGTHGHEGVPIPEVEAGRGGSRGRFMVGRGGGWFDFGVGFGAGFLLVRVGTGGFSVRTFGFGVSYRCHSPRTRRRAAHTPALVALIFHHDTVAEHPDMNISAQTSLPTSWASR